ncbi:hypothetical protein KHC23_19075 [Ancylobacter dichloromethanicus]|uniref:Uncharacterized protein n=1 Tax=Ancylobacter dichloromethanicus TaxID=518825 RepID=A0A9W6J8H6_9HYPH|nr:hypothetical protein [Ancylobacter dichloromethanicus]MBS7555739.1 hypothetical protein [Ancylobacter dichloromethanicus]GLK72810.1 hypothetical protein GCM10017643_29260 [Ancylobacter dichloromethanicus]
MKKCIVALLGLVAVLVSFLAFPFLPVADATTDPSHMPKGYKTCFMERHAVYTDGAPRWVKAPRCVFAE